MRTAVDLFAGAGGATQGLKDAGFDVVAAIENDRDAARSFALNHPGVVLAGDIRDVDPERLRRFLGVQSGELDLLKACPPCQGFSSLARGAGDSARNDLVLDLLRFTAIFSPKAIILENVPGLARDARLGRLLEGVTRSGYVFSKNIVDAVSFGVPQRRRRLIVIAVRRDIAKLVPNDLMTLLTEDFDVTPRTAGDALLALAGELRADDKLNRSRVSRASTIARIANIPVNGTRFDLPAELQLTCHKRLKAERGSDRSAATSSYGRVRASQPSPTMTTRCTTPSCGSFVHPVEDRGLTLREAATFQTFPPEYQFEGGYDSIERQIGNAVPVRMATALGTAVMALLSQNL